MIGPRAKLILVASLFVLPIAASVITYRYFPPPPTGNYGELLLPPRTLPADQRVSRWVLLATEDGEKLAAMEKVRLALGRDASRVETRVMAEAQLARAGIAADRAHIYLVDPHGNVMMRWPAEPDLRRMLDDLKRLLKASQIG